MKKKSKNESVIAWGPVIFLLIIVFFGLVQLQLHGYAKRTEALERKPSPIAQIEFLNEWDPENILNEISLLKDIIREHKESIHYGRE